MLDNLSLYFRYIGVQLDFQLHIQLFARQRYIVVFQKYMQVAICRAYVQHLDKVGSHPLDCLAQQQWAYTAWASKSYLNLDLIMRLINNINLQFFIPIFVSLFIGMLAVYLICSMTS